MEYNFYIASYGMNIIAAGRDCTIIDSTSLLYFYCNNIVFSEGLGERLYRAYKARHVSDVPSSKFTILYKNAQNLYIEIPYCCVSCRDKNIKEDNHHNITFITTSYIENCRQVPLDIYNVPGDLKINTIYNYCLECGIKLYKPQLKCWACENGI